MCFGRTWFLKCLTTFSLPNLSQDRCVIYYFHVCDRYVVAVFLRENDSLLYSSQLPKKLFPVLGLNEN